jgi:hypothetical protein
MPATAEQLRIAEAIEMKMRQLLGAGCNDVEILAEMFILPSLASFQTCEGTRNGEAK